MNIKTEIERIVGNIGKAYAACGELGAKLPPVQDSAHLEEVIRTIQAGGEFAVPLRVDANAGANITATLGDESVSGTVDEAGKATLLLPAPGIWTVSGTLNGVTKTSELEVADGYNMKFSLASRVPETDIEVEYVEFAKTTTIYTYLSVPTNATRIVMEMMPLEEGSKTQFQIIQGRAKPSSYSFELSLYQSYNSTQLNAIGLVWWAGRTTGDSAAWGRFAYTLPGNKKIKIDFDPPHKKISLADTVIDLSSYTSNYTSNVSLYIGEYINHASNYYTYPMRVYSMQVYVNDELVGDFIPCKKGGTTPALYNAVTNSYTNTTYGTLTAGPAV